MYRGSDSVFRLSLIGTAFIFILFLLVVFGWMYADADISRTEALARLDKRQQENALPLARDAFESASRELQTQLAATGVNADEVIQRLLDKTAAEAEAAALKARVQELNTQLAGLTEVRDVLALAGKSSTLSGTTEEELLSALELRMRLKEKILALSAASDNELTDNEISAQALMALELLRQIETRLEQELGQPLAPGQETVWAKWLVETRLSPMPDSGNANNAPPQPETNARNNPPVVSAPTPVVSTPAPVPTPARSQPAGVDLASLPTRLGTHNTITAPPCWVDRTGDAQFLLMLELRPGGVHIAPAWPPEREAEARAIPGIERLLSRSQIPYNNLDDRIRPVAQHSGKQCHYTIQVRERLRDAMRSERVHQQLETLFNLTHLPR
ncbi:MAG: hypothetical protein LBL48_01795 [Azoarcus sp.]|jgi:hypothetical protein|nr:hypothetical protein [Azoarcus sp.]